ncbi:YdcF family protein [Dokdonella sp.]|uniref:YdcF family protein n=1 Tax=Dokdonella sp. TaxID=2291710 RepID=UPI0035289F0E
MHTFLSPFRSGVLLALLLMLSWRWLPRWLRWPALVPIFACVLLSLPVVANPLVRWQESRVHIDQDCALKPPSTIVVLSGGTTRNPASEEDISALGESSIRRMFAATIRLQLQTDTLFVIAGGAAQYKIAESRLMAELARQLGVPSDAIRLEMLSRSTWQNAEFVAALRPAVDKRIWLVTSALHLPRATYAFEQNGFEVCAWPADPLAAEANSPGYFLPSTTGLRKSEALIHEWVGEAAYRMGWLRGADRDPWSGSDER